MLVKTVLDLLQPAPGERALDLYAGVGLFGKVAELSTDDLDQTLAVNVRGPFLCCREALKRMIPAKSGYIINIASVSAHLPLSRVVSYSSAKAAVLNLSLFLAREWAPRSAPRPI